MKRFLLCMALLSSAYLLSNDEYSGVDYGSFNNNNNNNNNYQSNNYDGIGYQRIGRFSDEDFFDISCVNDVIACAPVAVKKIIINLLYPPKNKAALPKRLLLVGKPGTGKTTLAKAIAHRCGYDYYLVEAPFLLNEYKNSGPQNLLREIYPLLYAGRPVVVILDELTELTDRYKKENDSDATVGAALWILLDACAQFDNVFFIGTSNKDKKDLPAQLQSRFDEDIVTIYMPHAAARKRMLKHYLKGERHKIDGKFLRYLIKKTDGRSAREIEKLVFKAIQFANVRIPRRYTVTAKDFERALKLWKPFWHPTVIYQTLEPHIQPFFKTAFPIILQAIGVAHNIYSAERQHRSTERSLTLQEKSYLLQAAGQAMQQEGLGYQKEGLGYQKEGLGYQKEGLGYQKEGLGYQKEGLGYQKEGLGYQKEGLGYQKEGLGYQKEGLGYQKEGLGYQKEGLGYQKEGLGYQKEGLGYQKEGLGYQKEGLGYQKEGLGYQKEGLGYQKEGLGYQKEGLGCQKEGLGYQKEGLGYQKEGLDCQKTGLVYQKISVRPSMTGVCILATEAILSDSSKKKV